MPSTGALGLRHSIVVATSLLWVHGSGPIELIGRRKFEAHASRAACSPLVAAACRRVVLSSIWVTSAWEARKWDQPRRLAESCVYPSEFRACIHPEVMLSHFARIRLPPALATFGTGQCSTKTAAPGVAGVLVVRPGGAPHTTGTAGARAAIWGERRACGFPV